MVGWFGEEGEDGVGKGWGEWVEIGQEAQREGVRRLRGTYVVDPDGMILLRLISPNVLARDHLVVVPSLEQALWIRVQHAVIDLSCHREHLMDLRDVCLHTSLHSWGRCVDEEAFPILDAHGIKPSVNEGRREGVFAVGSTMLQTGDRELGLILLQPTLLREDVLGCALSREKNLSRKLARRRFGRFGCFGSLDERR